MNAASPIRSNRIACFSTVFLLAIWVLLALGSEVIADEESPEASPLAAAEASSNAAPVDAAPVRLRFSFKYAPWKDVLDWLAEESGSALTMESPPPGTFNYTDPRYYSVPEAIDRINSLLLTKGYTLVRRGKMLLLVNLEDGVPPNLVPR